MTKIRLSLKVGTPPLLYTSDGLAARTVLLKTNLPWMSIEKVFVIEGTVIGTQFQNILKIPGTKFNYILIFVNDQLTLLIIIR